MLLTKLVIVLLLLQLTVLAFVVVLRLQTVLENVKELR